MGVSVTLDANGALKPQTLMLSKYSTLVDGSVNAPIQMPKSPGGIAAMSEEAPSAPRHSAGFPAQHAAGDGDFEQVRQALPGTARKS